MSDADIKKGVNLCLDNAKILLEEADSLLTKGSTGHAFFFVVSAIEETSKAHIWTGARVGSWTQQEINDVTKHAVKLTLFIIHLAMTAFQDGFERGRKKIFHQSKPTKPLDVDDLVEMLQDMVSAKDALWKGRQEGLYVDRRDGKWTSPADFEKSEVENLIKRAGRYLKQTEIQTRNILEADIEVSKDYKSWLEEHIPFAVSYLVENIDELYVDKVISRGLYEKLKKLKDSLSSIPK